MKTLVLTLVLLTTACGIKHKVSGRIEPIDVNVNHKIDYASLVAFFKEQCKLKLSEGGTLTPTPQEIDQCVSDSVFDFMDALEAAGR